MINEETRFKIDKAIKSGLVGIEDFSETELSSIFEYAGMLLRQYDYIRGGIPIGNNDDNLIFVAVINVIKGWETGGEDSFLQYIYRTLLGTEGSGKVYAYITSLIQEKCKQYDLPFLESCGKRYYGTVLAHALSPKSAMNSFFDLCWDIFCKDLCLKYTPKDPIFKSIVNSLASMVDKESGSDMDEVLTLGSSVYNLKAGLKRLSVDGAEEMVSLIDTIIGFYDKAYNKAYVATPVSYLDRLLSDWWQAKLPTLGQLTIRKPREYEKAAIDYNHINPRFEINNGECYLVIPPIRLINHLFDSPSVSVLLNDDVVYENNMDTSGSGLAMTTKAMRISLSQICQEQKDLNIKILINHCGTIIFDSKKQLNREFILFNDKHEITGCDHVPGSYYIFATDIDAFSLYPEKIRKQSSFINNIVARDGESLHCRSKKVFFSFEHQDKHAWIDGDRQEKLCYKEQGEEYWVFNDIRSINITKSKELTISQYSIKLDDEVFPLSLFNVDETADEYIIDCKGIFRLNTCVSVSVFNIATNAILLHRDIIQIAGLAYSFDKPFYFGDGEIGILEVKSETQKAECIFDICSEDIACVNFFDGTIEAEIPAINWRLDSGPWQKQAMAQPMWYKQTHNNALIEIKPLKGIDIRIGAGNRYLETIGNDSTKYELGKYLFTEETLALGENIVFLSIDNKPIAELIHIYTKAQFISMPYVEIKNGIFSWDPTGCFIGDRDSAFRFTVKSKSSIIFQQTLTLSSEKIMVGNIEEGIFSAIMELKAKSIITKYDVLNEFEFVIGDYKNVRFKGKAICLKTVMLASSTEEMWIKRVYIESPRYLCEKDGFDFYTGKLYIENRYGYKVYLNTMKNRNGVAEQINPIRIELRSSTTLWLVVNYQGPSFYDFDGEIFYDDEYKQITNNDRTGKAIDYYGYSVKEISNV